MLTRVRPSYCVSATPDLKMLNISIIIEAGINKNKISNHLRSYRFKKRDTGNQVWKMETIMKKSILICFVALLFFLTSTGYAIDYIWKDDTGIRIYDCGGFAVGGHARIKDLGDGTFRAQGVKINRIIRASSIFHAAQIVCGEKPEYEPAPQQQPEK